MDNIIEVASGFILGLGIIAPFFLKAKAIIKEVSELMVELNDCLDDGKISKVEIAEILKEASDILGLFKK